MNNNQLYNYYIYDIYKHLKKNKIKLDNNNLWRIFEYYTCILLNHKYNDNFLTYDDLEPSFKEDNQMTQWDTGIDACNYKDTIVQCKLRNNTLNLKEVSTFLASQNGYCEETQQTIIKWKNMIISRNDDCNLSEPLKFKRDKNKLFIDYALNKEEMIQYCDKLLLNPPIIQNEEESFKLRNYQEEAIQLIKENKNCIINIPTGSGKNIIMIYSICEKQKYLIFVPRIILMYQFKQELIKHKPQFKNKIQLLGDNYNQYNNKKLITICVYNSIDLIPDEEYSTFNKIFIDEAHHIYKPFIYYNEEDLDLEDINSDNEEDLEEIYSDFEEDINSDYEEDIEDINSDFEEDINSNKEIKSLEVNNIELINDLIDDNENSDSNNYIYKLQELQKYNNNVYFSATIDNIDNFNYYSKNIREFIDNKYLCDYQIKIPIFNDNATQKDIYTYLINNYSNIIIYTSNQNRGKEITKLMNGILKDCCDFIDCNTTKRKREIILNKFNKGELLFIVNVRILIEGFNSPICKGVYLENINKSKTNLIQIIGRTLRLHPEKIYSSIILPYQTEENEKSIQKFINILGENDYKIKNSILNHKIGGYIQIKNTKDIIESDIDKNNEVNEINSISLKYEKIYDSLDIENRYIQNWKEKYNELIEFIENNHKRPNQISKNKEEKRLATFIQNCNKNYKNKVQIMKNIEIYNLWNIFLEKYKDYVKTNIELWKDNYNQLIEFIENNHKKPSYTSKNKEEKKLASFIQRCNTNYKNKLQIMENIEIYNLWNIFLDKYKDYLKTNIELWKEKYNQLIEFIESNHKRPSSSSKNKEEKQLGTFITIYNIHYKNKKYIMKNIEIYNLWSSFLEKYRDYFKSNEELWRDNYNQLIEFIENNHKRPSCHSKNIKDKQLARFIESCNKNYKNKVKIMKNIEIYNLWTSFLDKYKNYLKTDEELWKEKYNQLIEFIENNHKRPKCNSKNKEEKQLSNFIQHCNKNYKHKVNIMKNIEIYNLWSSFLDKYKDYFKSK
mgnify:CR=1 FL=1